MSNLSIIFIVGIVPMLIEAFIVDPFYWQRGKSDKPWSTVLRVFFTIAFMFIFGAEISLAILGWYMFFDLLTGMILQGDPFYTGDGWWDRRIGGIPWFFSLGWRLIAASFFWGGFWYINSRETIFTAVIDWLNGWM